MLDVTAANLEAHHETTMRVLNELAAGDKRMLTVFNKVDAATPEQISQARRLAPDAIFISARTGHGLDALQDRCIELIADAFGAIELLVPHARYDIVAKLHSIGHVQFEEQRDDGVYIQGRFPPAQAALYQPFVLAK